MYFINVIFCLVCFLGIRLGFLIKLGIGMIRKQLTKSRSDMPTTPMRLLPSTVHEVCVLYQLESENKRKKNFFFNAFFLLIKPPLELGPLKKRLKKTEKKISSHQDRLVRDNSGSIMNREGLKKIF